MNTATVRSISSGLSQKGVRNHNERLLLSLLLRHGSLPASELSRRAGLSPPTISAILKRLEAEAIHISRKIVNPRLIDTIRCAGFSVCVYTVNDEKTRSYLKASGANGVITDFPQRFTAEASD